MRLIVNDKGLIDWLWGNAAKVEKANRILRQKKSKATTLEALKKLLAE